ncbi:MarR family winged helix-turn-helix transcriptional regulator [Oricola sp.]|uniref:MarR family winged helix-turn-helix transcriptional regulator n=1 Tax=Oricola sp. TaxID=1979950 RepID=UPI003BAB121F
MTYHAGNTAHAEDQTLDGGRRPTRAEIEKRLAESGFLLEEHNAYLIRLAHQRGTALFQKAFEGYGITPTQVAVLATLLRHGDLPQNQLGRITAIDTATLSTMLRRLEALDLTERVVSPSDQRVNLIRLTDKGIGFTLDVVPISRGVSDELLAPLNQRERKRFIELLKKVAR